MYTPSQASEMLQIPPSTLRRYAKQFKTHLSERARRGRGRQYTEADIAIMARAREFLNQGNNPKKTNELLSIVAEDQPVPDSTLAKIPAIATALTEAVDTSRALRLQVDDLSVEIKDLKERQDKTDETTSELLSRIEQLEHERDNRWQHRLSRLFRRSETTD